MYFKETLWLKAEFSQGWTIYKNKEKQFSILN